MLPRSGRDACVSSNCGSTLALRRAAPFCGNRRFTDWTL